MTDQVDRFFAAVSVLAGHGHIKHRLIKAYQDNLDHINEDNLPNAVKQPFAQLKSVMHCVTPAGREGSICASVRKMSVDEASQCAVSVVSLYSEIIRHDENGQELLPLTREDGESVPPFLIKSVS
jgi:hypothetical protein